MAQSDRPASRYRGRFWVIADIGRIGRMVANDLFRHWSGEILLHRHGRRPAARASRAKSRLAVCPLSPKFDVQNITIDINRR